MRRCDPSLLVLALSACAASDPPPATQSLPVANGPVAASLAPSASATPSSRPPAPVASVSASASASATARDTPPEPPIPTTPLAGTVDGRRFVAVSALAAKDPDHADWRTVWAFDRAVACGAKLPPPGVRAVSISVPWQIGGFGTTAAVAGGGTVYSNGGSVLEVPTQPGGRARLVVRVHADTIDVAGELRPVLCR